MLLYDNKKNDGKHVAYAIAVCCKRCRSAFFIIE